MVGVLLALLARAEGLAGLRNVDLIGVRINHRALTKLCLQIVGSMGISRGGCAADHLDRRQRQRWPRERESSAQQDQGPPRNPEKSRKPALGRFAVTEVTTSTCFTMRRRTHASQSDEDKNGSGPELTPPSSDDDEFAADGEPGKAGASTAEDAASKGAGQPKRTLLVRKRGGAAPAANGASPPTPSATPSASDSGSPKQPGRRAQQPKGQYKKQQRATVRISLGS